MNNNEVCSCTVVHDEVIEKVINNMPEEEVMLDLADFYKSFSDLTRMKIICALLESEMCVCDLAHLLKISQPAVSHQLRTLRQARLVKFRREGKVVYYSLDDDHVRNLISEGLAHIKHK